MIRWGEGVVEKHLSAAHERGRGKAQARNTQSRYMEKREEESMESHPDEPKDRGGLMGSAAIKYTAILFIVIVILVLLAIYVIPLVSE